MNSTFRHSVSNSKNILIVVSFLLYFLAFYQKNQIIIGSVSGALAAIPIAIFAWYYGKRAGAIGALVVIVLNLGMWR